jgi:hypothetical protein
LAGQLLTPLTMFPLWGDPYAIDNGAFTTFKADKFAELLDREADTMGGCLFVSVPDVVGSARRTRELWDYRFDFVPHHGWPLAYVAQDGAEDANIPWDDLDAIFIGGTTEWKLGRDAAAIVKTAKVLGRHVHIGRVNTPERFWHFERLGADTCDGTGLALYPPMLAKLAASLRGGELHPLFD